ncbi:GATA transcription factor 11 [Striga hermonthica]|uniref:GATA transcription factor 11 n=1 Tax=Striga hermonthica TaxID=68872 RepID=A0A9N7MQT4_STRHE|nr:GATA transcription factor 11 [Striga hermonthica]
MDEVEPYDCWEVVVNGCLEDKDLDNILSILDSPVEGFEWDGLSGEWEASKSNCLGPVQPNVLTDSGQLVLPPLPTADAAAPLEQYHQSSFQPKGTTFPLLTNKFTDSRKEKVAFHTQSPVSVLEGNNCRSSVIKSCTSKRARSKRARPLGLSPWLFMLPPFAATGKAGKAKGRRKKPSPIPGSEGDGLHDHTEPRNGVKKCSHCEVTKTPQWREGPLGPKTLCNACGVRYRSGRLLPEYRPAASPTFVPSVHSNSHRKVIQMRNKATQQPPGEVVGPIFWNTGSDPCIQPQHSCLRLHIAHHLFPSLLASQVQYPSHSEEVGFHLISWPVPFHPTFFDSASINGSLPSKSHFVCRRK